MRLVCKQLLGQMIKDKIFLSLLLLLIMLTSLSFYFVMFSIDGNLGVLNALEGLSEDQQLYKNALNSNTILAYNFLPCFIGLTALVFIMFFYRFFRAGKKQIGCIKALGFKDQFLQLFFLAFTAILSFLGALLGLIGGYFLSDVLLNAYTQTYMVTGLVKEIGGVSLIMGILAPAAVFCLTAYFCYGFVRNKEAGSLLAGDNRQNRFYTVLRQADKISRIVPAGRRFSLRLALRKPLSVLLLFTAVMSFNVCLILGQSLHISSAKVVDAQTDGHNYEYEIRYLEYKTADIPGDAMVYIDTPAIFSIGDEQIERTMTGLYDTNEQFVLKNQKSEILSAPETGKVYLNPELSEIYGVEIGDTLTVVIMDRQYSLIVKDVAVNAETKCIYMNGQQLAEILGVSEGAYNGVLSAGAMEGDNITTRTQRMEELNRNAVSNKVSGVINQAVGILIGAILIFLVLYINFQDNSRDILILHMIGHRSKDIRKMLIDVYLPILWTAFAATLAPSIFLAKTIQKSLSISTNDYMPFGINLLVVLTAFSLISLIYWGVQITFHQGVKRMTVKSEIAELIYGE